MSVFENVRFCEYGYRRREYGCVSENGLRKQERCETPDHQDDAVTMTVRGFIELLAERYHLLRENGALSSPELGNIEQCLTQLALARAALRYAAGCRPLQLAVLGPTQTGKSTIVNLILGTSLAEVSPLAGFTVHPQGFWNCGGGADDDWIGGVFPGWSRSNPGELSGAAGGFNRYLLEKTAERVTSLPACVVWDTPDFDSLAARSYQGGVLEVAALADLHVFVLSKEKYSDLSVWRMLELLKPLGRPLIICLNKITPDAAESVISTLKQRLAAMGGEVASVPIITFGYHPGLDSPGNQAAQSSMEALRERITDRLRAPDPATRVGGLQAFVKLHWKVWTAPLETEQTAVRQWGEMVAAALEEAAESYRRDFLDHPQRFDTFRRATVELLHLLELPGVGDVLSQVRHVLSWPARRLFAVRQAWNMRRRKAGSVPHGLGSEEVVLFDLIEKLLTSLERDVTRRCDPATPGWGVWRALAEQLRQQSSELRQSFETAARAQREDFAPVIHAAANRLYDTLRDKPRMLNTLRTARAATDVASIAIAIKTGGLGINDLLFAPAMFALTSMLTEGVMGSYMSRVAEDLKRKQLEHVRVRLLQGAFAGRLAALATDLQGAELFGISAEQLACAKDAVEAWERGEYE